MDNLDELERLHQNAPEELWATVSFGETVEWEPGSREFYDAVHTALPALLAAARLGRAIQKEPRYAAWLEEIRMWISEKVSFECDCEAYQESDTGAWIHNENTCAVFMEDHIDIVLKEVSGLLARAGEPQP
jgi:hypothetical protein